MELKRLKDIINNYPKNEILTEWEGQIISAFHIDSDLYLDSEVFEIMEIKTKKAVLKLIDLLITKVKERRN